MYAGRHRGRRPGDNDFLEWHHGTRYLPRHAEARYIPRCLPAWFDPSGFGYPETP